MPDAVLTYIGGRIRLYRKMNKLTMEELAMKVHKTKASISKYESGQTSMDIGTLFEIAAALNITPNQLIPCMQPGRNKECVFEQPERRYLYHMNWKTVHSSILELGPKDENGRNATLFYKISKSKKLEDCSCVYHGQMVRHDMVLNLTFNNYNNPVESILINFSIPIRKSPVLIGMISGLGENTLAPTSHRIVLSNEPIDVDSDQLHQMLRIDPKLFKDMKNANMLFIPR
ncbi:MAG: helix-turn-helix domain-containing protein [Lachnospiraceae bacterium]